MQLNTVKTFLKWPGKILISVFVIAAVVSVAAWLCIPPPIPPPPPPPDPLLPYVKLESKWTLKEFKDFISALDQDRRNSLKKALKIGDKQFNSKEEEIFYLREQFQWICYRQCPYICDPPPKYQYHVVVQAIASKLNINKDSIVAMTTFELERKILEATFAGIWDKLTPEQRIKVLEKMDKAKTLDCAGIAAMSGAGAIAALSATVYFSGFAFYTGMSSAIASSGSLLGVPMPMSAYSTASSTAAPLSGPVGWGIAEVAVAAAGGRWPPRGLDLQPFAATIIQIHYIKVQALYNSGVPVPAVKAGDSKN